MVLGLAATLYCLTPLSFQKVDVDQYWKSKPMSVQTLERSVDFPVLKLGKRFSLKESEITWARRWRIDGLPGRKALHLRYVSSWGEVIDLIEVKALRQFGSDSNAREVFSQGYFPFSRIATIGNGYTMLFGRKSKTDVGVIGRIELADQVYRELKLRNEVADDVASPHKQP